MTGECCVNAACQNCMPIVQNLTGYFTPDNTLVIVNGLCQTRYIAEQTYSLNIAVAIALGMMVGIVMMFIFSLGD